MAQKYNLRSGKKETVLPVQLQLCDDQDFMSQMLGGVVNLSQLNGKCIVIYHPVVILNFQI